MTNRLRDSTPDFLSGFTPLDELPSRVVESHLPEFEAVVFMCRMPFLTHNPPYLSGLGTGI